MAFEIKWTPAAKENYHAIVSYIYDEFGADSAEKFTDELQTRLQYLEKFPFIGRQHSSLSAVRQLVISKHQMLFYTVLEDSVIVLNVIDNETLK